MKKLMILFVAISLVVNLNAQDIIIKKTGDEIETKITEVGLDNVKYMKYDNIDGPIYIIPKYEVLMIKYENGSKDIFNDIKQEEKGYIRKGLHLGLHITPGIGAILMDNYVTGFGINTGADLSIYFNDYVGIKTGISYLNLPMQYIEYYNPYYPPDEGHDHIKGNISSLGIPIKFLLTTGNETGLYIESGLSIYFPITSSVENLVKYHSINTFIHESAVLAAEAVLGFNIKTSEIMSLNFGTSFHYSLTKNFSGLKTKGFLAGVQMGILFKLSK